MTTLFSLHVATEEMTELEKVLQAQKAADKNGASAVLLNDVKQEAELETEEETDPSAVEEGDNPPESDAEPPSSDENPEDETPPSGDEQSELRASDEPLEDTAALESMEGAMATAAHYTGKVLGLATDGLIYLFRLGVQQTPLILKNLYRGVLYVSVKTAKFLYNSSVTVEKYITRHRNSFSKLQEDIKLLKTAVKELEKKQQKDEGLGEQQYTKDKIINALKVGQSLDFSANMALYSKFLSSVVKDVDTNISYDMALLKHMLTVGGSVNAAGQIPKVRLSANFKEGVIDGYEAKSELVKSYVYSEKLPGDTVFMMVVPDPQLNSIDSFSKACASSSLFFGIDSQNFVSIDTMKVMTLGEVSIFLDKLEEVCRICEQHRSLYDKVNTQKNALRNVFRDYFNRLLQSEQKVGIKASLGQNIYLTTTFVDQVFIAGAMDIHDYTIRLVNKGLTCVKDQLSYY